MKENVLGNPSEPRRLVEKIVSLPLDCIQYCKESSLRWTSKCHKHPTNKTTIDATDSRLPQIMVTLFFPSVCFAHKFWELHIPASYCSLLHLLAFFPSLSFHSPYQCFMLLSYKILLENGKDNLIQLKNCETKGTREKNNLIAAAPIGKDASQLSKFVYIFPETFLQKSFPSFPVFYSEHKSIII